MEDMESDYKFGKEKLKLNRIFVDEEVITQGREFRTWKRLTKIWSAQDH